MKKVCLLSFAFAALMLGACSSENELVDVNGGAEWNAEGTGYINLAIQLPTQPNNRAVSLEDGTPAEYEVKDATLILFTGSDEANATINSAYDMNLNFTPVGGTTDQITTTSKITQKINEISSQAGKIYALVVLNNNGLLTVDGSDLKVNGQLMANSTLSALNKAVNEATATAHKTSWHGEGFLMSNATMADAVGDANSQAKLVGPLVEISRSKIFSTKEEATLQPAADIYVERAEAKVTLKDGIASKTASNVTVGNTPGAAAFTILGWDIDNYNQTNKLVRTVDATGFEQWKTYTSNHLSNSATDFRFIGTTSIANNWYRVYWGDDYNYSSDKDDSEAAGSVDFSLVRNTTSFSKNANGEDAAYCFENTTSLARMLEKNLTRVIVKAQFNSGNSFYTLDGDNTKIWSEDNTKIEILQRLLHDVDFEAWAKDAVKNGSSLDALKDLSFEFSAKDNSNDGSYKVKNITLTESGEEKLNSSYNSLPENIVEWANKHIKLTYYPGGIVYYPVYIKHFGDVQTPWDKSYAENGVIYEESNKDANYLGRYGVLRNNWYEITVNSIKNLGTPVIEDPTDQPADKKESYISVTINILSWAKRTQEVNL